MLTASISLVPITSFALVQNGIATIRNIEVKNDTLENLQDIKVRISFDPAFAEPITEHILSLPAGEAWSKSNIQPAINSSFLCNLTEKIISTAKVEVIFDDDEVLASTSGEISVLDYSQYWGNEYMPQYLAAFVTPNHIALDPILKRASEILAKWTGNSALSGYCIDAPERPKMIIGAIYEAIAEQKITYCYPTISLARHGQKIRTCEDLVSQDRGKRGCCLDMALLLSSCLEAAGLHPIIVMQDDHAFAGCWMINEMFEDCVLDDPTALTKRAAEGINEIILVDATCANEGNNSPFSRAVSTANEHMKETEKFCYLLDISRARLAGIQPIPQRIFNGSEYEVSNPEPETGNHTQPEGTGKTYSFDSGSGEFTRFDLWEHRLLDLSSRNNLLNLRFRKNTLRLMSVPLGRLIERLNKSNGLLVLERPKDWMSPANSRDLGERISDDDPIHGLLNEELSKDRLRTYQEHEMVTETLTGLYRAARLSLEESGANTLFLALGFLKWMEPGTGMFRYSPILLYPVRIERKSVNKGYTIISRGEDPMLNETLFEYLRQICGIDIPDLSKAFGDEVDIRYILAAVRKTVIHQDRWDVIDEAVVSIFDFNRFVIWNDLRSNRQRMSEHPLISSLVSGKLNLDEAEEAERIGELPADETAIPISADSSQLAAIHEAGLGKSFVLHGPPGTGKSQTITNIISNALFHGKRVLFVAEKMAALEVVQKRLDAIGLGPFCLELHSNKTKKSLVMDQLRRTTEVAKKASDDAFSKEGAHLDYLKEELNRHVESLHKIQAIGLSIYDCIAGYSGIEMDNVYDIDMPDVFIASLTQDSFKSCIEVVENFASVATSVSAYGNVLNEIGLTDYSPAIKAIIENQINITLDSLSVFSDKSRKLKELLGLGDKELTNIQYAALDNIAMVMLVIDAPQGLFEGLDFNLLKAIEDLTEAREKLDLKKGTLLRRFREDILRTNHLDLKRQWIEAGSAWFLKKFFERNRLTRLLTSYTKDSMKLEPEQIESLFEELEQVHEAIENFDRSLGYTDQIRAGLSRSLGKMSGKELRECYEHLAVLSRETAHYGSAGADILSGLENISAGGWEGFRQQNESIVREYREAYENLNKSLSDLEEKTESDLTITEGDWIGLLTHKLKLWKENIDNLRGKVAYNIVRRILRESGIPYLSDLFENRLINAEDIVNAFKKSLFKNCADYYISKDKELGYFQSILFEDKIKRFRKLCAEFEDITRREMTARITAMLPALQKEASQSSDVGFLQKCIRNGCRGVSIRKLFETIPDLISRMCPAMLMSPLSVSQYLGANWPEFDLVIFDEASQMPTCEAVAAISRGRSTVIVGDEHQLPPTSFFMTENYNEQHSEVEDLDSILEDCLALSMPQKHLLWHYRSKHESLITFSNRHFYSNSLLTFPSNDDMASKVTFEYVRGVYERGKGRYNKEEAKAVVREIQKRLSDPETAGQSIGVVTFNVNQQSLIEDTLNEMLRKNPDLEKAASQMHEPIFIKNLENVQGDERDVVLFSVGYGYDRDGKVAMNFGPLNRDGGERRLNVAVSRARYEMKVFSSLKGDDIDIYRSNAKGVLYLKAFLEYAERGKVSSTIVNGMKGRMKDELVESVAKALRMQGHKVNTNVGSSEYRVDIGIVDPANPDKYLLGILCDGYNYNSGTARDRDVTTPAVLSLLGWKTYHIWAIEWWDTPNFVLDGIKRELEKIKSQPEQESDEMGDQDIMSYTEKPEDFAEGAGSDDSHEYVFAELGHHTADSAQFSEGQYTFSVMRDIKAIIDAEAPISRRLLIKKLLNSYGIARNGTRINEYLSQIFRRMDLITSGEGYDSFFWKDAEQLKSYSSFREAAGREALDIAPEEVAQAILQVLRDQFAIDEEGLIRETAYLFGFANVRDNVLASMKNGINLCLANELITLEESNNKYRLV